jgi:hypothetical protein
MSKKSLLVATVSAAVAMGASASAAFAGESTGNFDRTGKTTPVAGFVMHSICAFSGQNPERFLSSEDEDFEPGRTQSWGQIPKQVRDVIATQGEHPGDACNGHTGFLAGGGEE